MQVEWSEVRIGDICYMEAEEMFTEDFLFLSIFMHRIYEIYLILLLLNN